MVTNLSAPEEAYRKKKSRRKLLSFEAHSNNDKLGPRWAECPATLLSNYTTRLRPNWANINLVLLTEGCTNFVLRKLLAVPLCPASVASKLRSSLISASVTS